MRLGPSDDGARPPSWNFVPRNWRSRGGGRFPVFLPFRRSISRRPHREFFPLNLCYTFSELDSPAIFDSGRVSRLNNVLFLCNMDSVPRLETGDWRFVMDAGRTAMRLLGGKC